MSRTTVSQRCPHCGRTEGHWTPAKIIEAIQAWVAEHGDIPTRAQWRKSHPGHPADSQVLDRFGSWNAGMVAAGFTPRPRGGQVADSAPGAAWWRSRMSADEIASTGGWIE